MHYKRFQVMLSILSLQTYTINNQNNVKIIEYPLNQQLLLFLFGDTILLSSESCLPQQFSFFLRFENIRISNFALIQFLHC